MSLAVTRVCGDCTVCCTVAPVATVQLHKPPNTPCPHCVGTGCAIYASRPTDCRDSQCGWLVYQELDQDWRPDLSGVLILTEHDVPPKYERRVGLKFLLVDSDKPIHSARLTGYVIALVSRGVPVTFAVQGPPGHWPVKVFVNDALAPAVIRYDAEEVTRVLALLVRDLREGKFAPAVF